MSVAAPLPPAPAAAPADPAARGAGLVLAAAVVWSAGGLFARALGDLDPWTVIFWRSAFAALFLAGFVAAQAGPRGLPAALRAIGGAGLAVAACFAVASTAFVVALAHTTVANVLLGAGRRAADRGAARLASPSASGSPARPGPRSP